VQLKAANLLVALAITTSINTDRLADRALIKASKSSSHKVCGAIECDRKILSNRSLEISY